MKLFPNSDIETLENAPGGGSAVTLLDPEGFPLLLFHGQTPRNTAEYPTKLSFNYETEKPRSREFIRLSPGPAAVHKVRNSYNSRKVRIDPLTADLAWTLRIMRPKIPRAARVLHSVFQYCTNRLSLCRE